MSVNLCPECSEKFKAELGIPPDSMGAEDDFEAPALSDWDVGMIVLDTIIQGGLVRCVSECCSGGAVLAWMGNSQEQIGASIRGALADPERAKARLKEIAEDLDGDEEESPA